MPRKNYGVYRFPRERSYLETNFVGLASGLLLGLAIGTLIVHLLFP